MHFLVFALQDQIIEISLVLLSPRKTGLVQIQILTVKDFQIQGKVVGVDEILQSDVQTNK